VKLLYTDQVDGVPQGTPRKLTGCWKCDPLLSTLVTHAKPQYRHAHSHRGKRGRRGRGRGKH